MPLDTAILGGTGGVQVPEFKPESVLQKQAYDAETIKRARMQAIEDAKDQAAIVAAMKTHIGPDGLPDFDGAIKSLYPVNPRAAEALQAEWMKNREEDAKRRKAQLDNDTLTAKLLAQAADGVIGPDGTVDPDRYALFRKHAANIDPETQQYLGDTPDPKVVQHFISAGTEVSEANKIHEQAIGHFLKGDWQQALGMTLPLATTQAEVDKLFAQARANGMPKEIYDAYPKDLTPENQARWAQMSMTAKDRADITARSVDDARMAAAQAETARHDRAEEDVSKGNLQARQQELAQRGQAGPGGAATGLEITANTDPNAPHGADYLKTLPVQDQQMVKALAEGRQPWPAAFALKTPYWQKLVNEVFQYDPTMDTAAISNNARQKVRTDFTSGNSAKTVNALNTAIGHLANLKAAADHLGNTSVTSLNAVKNWIADVTGSAAPKTFEATREAVADELTRVWRQAGGSEQDIQERKKQLATSSSPEQFHSVIKQIGDLIESKILALQEQYRQGMGITDIEMITPESKQILNTLRGGSPTSQGPTGKVEDWEWDATLKRMVKKGGR